MKMKAIQNPCMYKSCARMGARAFVGQKFSHHFQVKVDLARCQNQVN